MSQFGTIYVHKLFNLSLYIGKVSAKYVRETPSVSKESVNDREYYRKEFDSTYHSLIYQLVKELQKQAEELQIAVDPAYDRFFNRHSLCKPRI